MPANIKAATSITKFDLDICDFDNTKMHAQFYKYMAKKYTNITDFNYSDSSLSRLDVSDRKYIYLNGVLDLFKVVKWDKRMLTLNRLPDDADVFQALDSTNTQIMALDLRTCEGVTAFQYLAQSSQNEHIETLEILNTSINSIHFIKCMPNHTRLQIFFFEPDSPPINLASCLYACPTSLKELIISCVQLIVEPFTKKLNSIETLDLGYTTLTSGLGDIISSCFPNMLRLKLNAIWKRMPL